jgi:ribosome modulation factor
VNETVDTKAQAFNEGYDAHDSGKKETDNPYELGLVERAYWLEGWQVARYYKKQEERYAARDAEKAARARGGMRELIAAVQHEIWAHWMKYLFSKCPLNDQGQRVIPAELVERWQRQIDTPYAELSGMERDSDRRQADKVIRAMQRPE